MSENLGFFFSTMSYHDGNKRKRKKSRKKEITEQIRVCRANGLKMRDDLLQTMQQKLVSFKYGGKKWLATHKTGLVIQVPDDGKYSMDPHLKAGDIFVWGESNWFCTFGDGIIVDMEIYSDIPNIIPHRNWDYERIKGPSMHDEIPIMRYYE